jgi:hypothetical protein
MVNALVPWAHGFEPASSDIRPPPKDAKAHGRTFMADVPDVGAGIGKKWRKLVLNGKFME